jgi:hypothetical protein
MKPNPLMTLSASLLQASGCNTQEQYSACIIQALRQISFRYVYGVSKNQAVLLKTLFIQWRGCCRKQWVWKIKPESYF